MFFYIFIFILLCIFSVIVSFYICADYFGTTPHQLISKKYYKEIYPEEIIDLSEIANEKIIFLVAAYNVDIKKLMTRIIYLSKGFKDFKIIIYALDSTLEISIKFLNIYKLLYPDNIILLPKQDLKKLNRMERIYKIRNILLQYIKNFDHTYKILIYDADHIGPMSKNGLVDAINRLNNNSNIYAICASGTNTVIRGFHFVYDTFAYINQNNKNGFKLKLHYMLQNYEKIISGFSGAVLYRYKDIINLKYEYKLNLCEHADLHQKLKTNFDMKFGKECFMEMSKKWHIYVGLQPSVK